MADKDLLISEKVEFSGVFSFEDAYSYAFDWFREEGYGLIEEKYKEKVTANGRDIEFEWAATKQLSDYFQINIKVKTRVSDLSDVEVESEGRKKKSNKGRIEIGVKGILVKDPESKWDESPLYKFLREVYNKYIIPGRIDSMEDRAKDDVRDFKEQMKLFFEISGKR